MRKILIDDAIRAIHPDAQFTTVDDVITEWNSPDITQPTQAVSYTHLTLPTKA